MPVEYIPVTGCVMYMYVVQVHVYVNLRSFVLVDPACAYNHDDVFQKLT